MYYREKINQKWLVYGVYDNVLIFTTVMTCGKHQRWQEERVSWKDHIIYENGLKLWFGWSCGLSHLNFQIKNIDTFWIFLNSCRDEFVFVNEIGKQFSPQLKLFIFLLLFNQRVRADKKVGTWSGNGTKIKQSLSFSYRHSCILSTKKLATLDSNKTC